MDGLKTGHTDAAGYCLIASADRNGMRLISVVLHAPSWDARTSEALLNYGFTNFETENVATAGAPVLKPRVYESRRRYAAVGAARRPLHHRAAQQGGEPPDECGTHPDAGSLPRWPRAAWSVS